MHGAGSIAFERGLPQLNLAMKDYALFGGCLRSEIALPDARPALAPYPNWTLRRVNALEPAKEERVLGEARIEADLTIRLSRHSCGLRLAYTDTGMFDVLLGGRLIHWLPGPEWRPDLVQLDVLNFVMATVLFARGRLCLHASAVAMAGGAIAFVGAKRRGKSTLALALTAAGAGLLGDDMVVVRGEGRPATLPGVPSVRLEADAAAYFGRLGLESCFLRKNTIGVAAHTDTRAAPVATPLRAIYMLAPDEATRGPAAARSRLSLAEAAIRLHANAKIAHLLDPHGAATLLASAASLAARVPVYSLRIVRDFGRLPEVVGQLAVWHTTRHRSPARTRPSPTALPSSP